MTYPGGKNGAGVYQRIINLMPPHEVYIEPFLGGAAIMRLKRPASLNIGIDLDSLALLSARAGLAGSAAAGRSYIVRRGDGIEFLRSYKFMGRELVYCDPPYMHETRSRLDLYQFEMSDRQHRELLRVLLSCFFPWRRW